MEDSNVRMKTPMKHPIIQKSFDIMPRTYGVAFGIHKWMIPDFITRYNEIKKENQETHLISEFSALNVNDETLDLWVEISKGSEPDTVELKLNVNKQPQIVPFVVLDKEATVDIFRDRDRKLVSPNQNWKEKLQKLHIVNGTLTIYIHYLKVDRLKIDPEEREQNLIATSLGIHRSNFEHLSDFTLISEKKSFPVHKLILANASSYFNAMFSNNECKENQNGEIEIKDLATEVVEIMINAMYTKEIAKNLTQNQLETLLEASDYYGIEYLRFECSSRLVLKFLNSATALHFLGIGLRCNANLLVKAAQPMILRVIGSICQTQQYAELMAEFPNALLKREAEDDNETYAKKRRL